MSELDPYQRLKLLIDETTVHARLAIDEYADIATRAAARLSSDPAKKPDTDWQDDALQWWAAVYRDSTKLLTLWQRSLEYGTTPKDTGPGDDPT